MTSLTDNRLMTRSWRIVLLGCLLMAPVSALCAQGLKSGGEVKGKVVVAGAADTERYMSIDRYGTHRPSVTGSQTSTAHVSAVRLSEKVVVFLEGKSFKARRFTPPLVHPVLDQKDLTFHPQVLPIVVGTTVDFPNRDNLFHNVFSYSQPREFDLGRYPIGESRSVQFDETGIVRVYCDIHAQMNATILVLDNPYFVMPTDDGTYSIKDVPEGSYTIKFWYGREVVESREISVKNGEVVTVNFTH